MGTGGACSTDVRCPKASAPHLFALAHWPLQIRVPLPPNDEELEVDVSEWALP